MNDGRVFVTPLGDGAWWRVTFGGTQGNILDAATMAALTETFQDAQRHPHLKAIVLEGAGPHFSFGASVQEHLPDRVEAMLGQFRDLVIAVLESSTVVLAAVRGQCLGGGLELATLAHRIFAHTGAALGQPEITLGVFAPAASVLLPLRMRRAHAEDLCLTGRIVMAEEAAKMGLVDAVVAHDPADAALEWATQHLGGKSARSLRLAVQAVRSELISRVSTQLPIVERLYLQELMTSADALEGLRAFLDKRPARWTDA